MNTFARAIMEEGKDYYIVVNGALLWDDTIEANFFIMYKYLSLFRQ